MAATPAGQEQVAEKLLALAPFQHLEPAGAPDLEGPKQPDAKRRHGTPQHRDRMGRRVVGHVAVRGDQPGHASPAASRVR
jgi:hypothetical protein